MHTEEAWFAIAAIRSDLVKDVPGGMTNLLRLLLSELFFNVSNGFHLEQAGIQLPFTDCPEWLFAKLKIIAADEKALKEIFCAKGASGFRICPSCSNVVSHLGGPARRAGYIPSTSLELHLMTQHTDQSVRAVLAELAELHRAWRSKEVTKNTMRIPASTMDTTMYLVIYSWTTSCKLASHA